MDKIPNNLFDDRGRRIPFKGMRVFNEKSKCFYKLKNTNYSFKNILSRSKQYGGLDLDITKDSFKSLCIGLKIKAENQPKLIGLFNGIHVPFICPKTKQNSDLGRDLEEETLPAVSASFKTSFPEFHFKATIQGSSKLSGELSVVEGSRYEKFVKANRKGPVAGWYFPQALQEYDIASQIAQMRSLPLPDDLILSGGGDIGAALVGCPNLLMNVDDYPPVLCLSALEHSDKHLMLCFKSYGLHLEFWCMSQMLTPDITQVSEQWSGGLTLYAPLR